ncbi:MAG: FG-GAP-like repeat-containing protein [Planctomycetota bacterium]
MFLKRPMGVKFGVGFFVLVVSAAVEAGTLSVVSVSPTRHQLDAPLLTPIRVTFNMPVNPATVHMNSFMVFGRWSGAGAGTYSFSNGNATVTLTPTRNFSAGEMVYVVLSSPLAAADGSPFRTQGYSYAFWTRTRPAAMNYTEIDEFSNRTSPGSGTRIYGASASDLNGDGYLDLTTVNEDSADLRVFMNLADNTGLYGNFLTPFPISVEASPNEPADFNRDGKPDLAAAAVSTSSVWIAMGNGNGTFGSAQQVSVGITPHGLAVLDADGDGDMDIVTSNTSSSNVALLLNNGSGTFGAATFFEGGGSGEYAISTGDFDNDGIMDLVVGARFSEDIIIHRGNGNGTFTNITTQDAGGSVWMIVCGDVNGDGNLDVTSGNSTSGSGSVLLGNGAGGLSLPTTYPIPGQTVASDLGDLDGDGDLDWMLSSFGGGVWYIYKNNGSGAFSFDQQFVANNNPSCAVFLDIDNDRDLDLALTDEIADLIKLEQNSGRAELGDYDDDNDVDGADLTLFSSCFSGTGVITPQSCMAGDFDLDGDIDCGDFGMFQMAWTAGGTPPEIVQCNQGPPSVPATSSGGLMVSAFLIVGAACFFFVRRRSVFSD